MNPQKVLDTILKGKKENPDVEWNSGRLMRFTPTEQKLESCCLLGFCFLGIEGHDERKKELMIETINIGSASETSYDLVRESLDMNMSEEIEIIESNDASISFEEALDKFKEKFGLK